MKANIRRELKLLCLDVAMETLRAFRKGKSPDSMDETIDELLDQYLEAK